ncbi:MAG: FAD binding domain-containing protein [Lachnospiraceae bacterium]|nr:FAD binding domain-containing protein [Lachnospiraceae bacterium]
MYTANEYRIVSSPEEAAELLNKSKRNRIIGGGMWMRLGKASYGSLIDISRLGLDKIEVFDNEIRLGAMVTLRDIEVNETLKGEFCGALSNCVRDIVGTQFRNMATLGGSVFLRAGFSDIVCVLLALDAEVVRFGKEPVALEKYLAAPRERELITHIVIKRSGQTVRYESLRQSRTDFPLINFCIAAYEPVNAADSQKTDSEKKSYRVCVGARPGKAVRCKTAEECLANNDLDGAVKAVQTLNFSSNMRGSAGYRKQMAGVLLKRAYECPVNNA